MIICRWTDLRGEWELPDLLGDTDEDDLPEPDESTDGINP